MKCPSKKHQHPSKGAAEAHLRALLRIEPAYRGHAYPCSDCRGWHVGRLKKNAHVSKYAAA